MSKEECISDGKQWENMFQETIISCEGQAGVAREYLRVSRNTVEAGYHLQFIDSKQGPESYK